MRFLPVAALFALTCACASSETPAPPQSSSSTSSSGTNPAPAPTQVTPEEEPFELFGAALAEGVEVVPFDTLLAQAEGYRNKNVELSGVVRASCQKRGCWMEVRNAETTSGSALTVRFKNYGFFVPLDSRGARVRMQGKMTVQVLSAEQVKEQESEGATIENKLPDGSAKVITFTASGVEMRGRGKK